MVFIFLFIFIGCVIFIFILFYFHCCMSSHITIVTESVQNNAVILLQCSKPTGAVTLLHQYNSLWDREITTEIHCISSFTTAALHWTVINSVNDAAQCSSTVLLLLLLKNYSYSYYSFNPTPTTVLLLLLQLPLLSISPPQHKEVKSSGHQIAVKC